MYELGKRLREVRMDRGITQYEMSIELGISLRVYQSYEQGKHNPSLENLVVIAGKLDVSTDWLLGLTDER